MTDREDIEIIREKINDNITLPESLSKENIVNMLSAEGTKKKNRGTLRRFVAAGIAACLILTSFYFLKDSIFFSPGPSSEQESTTEAAASYSELLQFIKAYAKDYVNVSDHFFAVEEHDVAMPSAPTQDDVKLYFTTINTSVQFGEVNLREKDVYEADIMITDGEYIYTVDNYCRRLNIIKAAPDGKVTDVWSYNTEENEGYTAYSGLYRYKNLLLATFTKTEKSENISKGITSGVMIYDLTDKASPELIKEISLDGALISSRVTDGQLILINRYTITGHYKDEAEENLLLPAVYNSGERVTVPCDCIYYTSEDAPECYVNVMNADLSDLDKAPVIKSYLGKITDTYCTKNTLYVISYDYTATVTDDGIIKHYPMTYDRVMIPVDSGKTRISKIDISGGNVKINGFVDFCGTVLNSYAIDEYNGYLRVAVQNNGENSLLVFNENLEKVGEITDIAPGERIKSARFMGNTAYLVTFLQTDPLFVIDLSSPDKPEIVGELKIPGFSSYLHPVGDGLLVGIGQGGTLTGIDGSSKISLFDVTDPKNPKETDSLVFPTSQLGTDPKSFCSVTENSFLVTYENREVFQGTYDNDGTKCYYTHSGALYIGVENGSLILKNSYLAKATEATVRATFIGNNVYIFNDGTCGLASFNMDTGEFISSTGDEGPEQEFSVPELSNAEILF